MGLNTTHGAWDGPYSCFNDFRYAIGKRIGINMDDYIGYNPMTGTKELDDIEHPVRYLLDHSDCDGELSPSECTLIAFGLDQIMNEITLDEMQANAVIYKRAGREYYAQDFYQDCENFKKGCLLAVRKRESLQFQ